MKKSDGIRANMSRVRIRKSNTMPSNSLKSGNGTPTFLSSECTYLGNHMDEYDENTIDKSSDPFYELHYNHLEPMV